jgi:predicted nuclease of predicted toxin-antitoxin system
MLRLASDADVHGALLRGLRRRYPGIDLVRVQDVLPEGTSDPEVLAWATAQNRVLITNDRNTMIAFAYQHATDGEPTPGLVVTSNGQSIGSAIEQILLIIECMSEEEIRNQVVVYLPLRA